ncbi:hypothetical protein TSTA_076920 [Talaromyces stipitatus ATCC 10500]|uniref:Uncharacterized protein n=1 Tax=Talaromyces stipitatus (strain ATCC 10500 / CBS 375.48 / QM 6759 / NRRL 1006) TaxID=441959 RepID=B8LVV9_TALSN|nr:uncharacterized protein TSTA_076920 [Talaromyces stipitatus ATCC 10500]EED24325.1 hypothetical protein TSTA_076920 [Talaromyces stipitatus ATCC 10500]
MKSPTIGGVDFGFTTGGTEDLIDGWFNDGIAEYYSLILLYVFGILTEDQFTQRFNWRISSYYTNPDRAVHNKDVQDRFWLPGRVHRIPYQRGYMYFVQLAYKLHNLELGRPMALGDYKDMSNAKQIILPSDGAGVWISNGKWNLEPVAQEEFYLEFPEENLSSESRVIRGLDLQSRAAEAGLREGDGITWGYRFLVDEDVWPKLFTMNVRGSNEETLRKIHLMASELAYGTELSVRLITFTLYICSINATTHICSTAAYQELLGLAAQLSSTSKYRAPNKAQMRCQH